MCNNNVFRTLRANEIECRAAQGGKSKKGVWGSFLLYKDARVDQRVMDETFGPMNWQASYEMIDGKMFCKVSVWDSEKNCWVSKMNVGTESNTEKDKGLASDCLKRACFTWGLGVELYSSPKIFVTLDEGEYIVKNDKICPTLSLSVAEIQYVDRRVTKLVLVDKNGRERFTYKADNMTFRSDNGKEITVGDKLWQRAVEQTAKGEQCKDGTPIPIWIAEFYHIPNEIMQVFTKEVSSYGKSE